ncbi:hypothetical protein Bca4012_089981 [Brassica carinata]|uniref:(rape) hypothetical protein n=1 Tax=Brassica napus TaxID=3708 RepID=A0A816RQJ7_BRANA|nr:unnamed protein product [Brassica napus]
MQCSTIIPHHLQHDERFPNRSRKRRKPGGGHGCLRARNVPIFCFLFREEENNNELEKWAEAVRDFEIVHQAMPYDKVIAKSLSQAQVALKQSRSGVVLNMESGGDVKEISSLEELKAVLARPDKSVNIIYL